MLKRNAEEKKDFKFESLKVEENMEIDEEAVNPNLEQLQKTYKKGQQNKNKINMFNIK